MFSRLSRVPTATTTVPVVKEARARLNQERVLERARLSTHDVGRHQRAVAATCSQPDVKLWYARTHTHPPLGHATCQRDLFLSSRAYDHQQVAHHTHLLCALSPLQHNDARRAPAACALCRSSGTTHCSESPPSTPAVHSPRMPSTRWTFCGNVWNKRGASSPIARALVCVHACACVRARQHGLHAGKASKSSATIVARRRRRRRRESTACHTTPVS
jgi:hypothetical protein